MPNICLQFGQCGGQLGFEFFDTLYNDVRGSGKKGDDSDWFSGSEARAIIVDTEDKVAADIDSKVKSRAWSYPRSSTISTHVGGSGNNWSRGFYENGPIVSEKVIDAVRKEAEKCDKLDSFFLMMSSAGGTGSGVGTFIAEKLKNIYPKNTISACLVLPNDSGEVTVQNYNTILSLEKLYDIDAIFMFSNDYLYKICSLLNLKQINYENLNSIISGQLSCVFNTTSLSKISFMTSHPDYKLLHMKSSPYYSEISRSYETPLKWDTVLRHVKMMLVKSDDVLWETKPTWKFAKSAKQRAYVYNKSISNLVSCCGAESSKADFEMFSSEDLYVPWVPKSDRLHFAHSNLSVQSKDKFCTLVSNNGTVAKKLDDMVDKAWKGFAHQAYTHHFYKYGTKTEDFVYTFAKLENIIKSYSKL